MLISISRRLALVSLASGLVVAGVALGSAPVGAAPQRSAAPAAAAAAKIISASLTHVSVAPKSTDAWAIGSQATKTTYSSYVVRRTGSNNWSKVSVKFPGTSPTLAGVAAGSPKSVWLIGNTTTKLGGQAFVLRSTGGAFKSMKVAGLGLGSTLSAIDASSSSNAWAIGTNRSGAIVLHWNGHKWKVMKLPKGQGGVILSPSAVTTSGPSNAWFIASSSTVDSVHWNGHKFSVATVTIPTNGYASSISTGSPSNTWIVGTQSVVTGTTGRSKTMTLHWNGHKWVHVSSPSPSYNSSLDAVTALGSQAYAVGSGYPKVLKNGLTSAAFVLHFASGHWHAEHATQRGRFTLMSSVDMSSKLAAGVGVWSAAAECTAKFVSHPLVESLGGSSWHSGSVPALRFGSTLRDGLAHLQMTPDAPNRPAC